MKKIDNTKQTIHELSLQDSTSTSSHSQNPPKSPLIRGTGRRAFTLVELIIVITILAILATIAFMSFQGYSEQTRDSNRLTTLKSIEKGLTLFQTKSGGYPETSSGITITASGTIVIGYQGTVGENVVRVINMNQVPLDPVDQTRYVYATNEPKSKYQLMAFMEGEDNLVGYVSPSYAGDQSERTPQSIGDNVGIVLEEDNVLPTSTVNVSSGTTNYKVVFGNSDEVTASGNTIFSQIYNRREDLMRDKTKASLDESLVGYWDMETTFQSGALTYIKDSSKYNINMSCHKWLSGLMIQNNCISYESKGKIGKGLYLNNIGTGYTSNISNWNYYYLFPMKSITLSSWINVNSISGHGIFRLDDSNPDLGNRLRIQINDDKTLTSYMILNAGATADSGINSAKINLGEWVYITTTFDYSTRKLSLYLNGVFQGNSIHSNLTDYIGGFVLETNVWDGSSDTAYDEIRIYNRALSDSEIKALYQASK